MSGRGESKCKGPGGMKESGLLQKRGEAKEKAEGQDLGKACLGQVSAWWQEKRQGEGKGRVKAGNHLGDTPGLQISLREPRLGAGLRWELSPALF